jgi:hypothetical protein
MRKAPEKGWGHAPLVIANFRAPDPNWKTFWEALISKRPTKFVVKISVNYDTSVVLNL